MVSSASPPRVSATIGIKSTPADLHDGRFAATFLLTRDMRMRLDLTYTYIYIQHQLPFSCKTHH